MHLTLSGLLVAFCVAFATAEKSAKNCRGYGNPNIPYQGFEEECESKHEPPPFREVKGDDEEDAEGVNRNAQKAYKWPRDKNGNVLVPYFFKTDQSAIKSGVAKAAKSFETNTCIRLKEVTADSNVDMKIRVIDGDGCYTEGLGKVSWYRNGVIEMSLQNGGCTGVATVLHEFMHILGFDHEQNRADRDEFIKLFMENVHPNYANQFDKVNDAEFESKSLGPYDCDSVMHYDSYGASKDYTSPTMERKNHDGDNKYQFGNEIGLTKWDIKKLNKFFGCANAPAGSGAGTKAPISTTEGRGEETEPVETTEPYEYYTSDYSDEKTTGEYSYEYYTGDYSYGSGDYSDGSSDYSYGDYSFGSGDYSYGDYSFGSGDYSYGDYSFGSGDYSYGDYSFGSGDYSYGDYSYGSGDYSYGDYSYGSGDYGSWFDEEYGSGDYSCGDYSYGSGDYSYGDYSYGSGDYSYGDYSYGSGDYSYGDYSYGSGDYSYGDYSYGSGDYGSWFDEEYGSGDYSCGDYSYGSGDYSYGDYSYGSGDYSYGDYGSGDYGSWYDEEYGSGDYSYDYESYWDYSDYDDQGSCGNSGSYDYGSEYENYEY